MDGPLRVLTLLGLLSIVSAYELSFELSVSATLTPEQRATLVHFMSRQFANSGESSSGSSPAVVVSGFPTTDVQQPSPPPPWLPGGEFSRFPDELRYGGAFQSFTGQRGRGFPSARVPNTVTGQFSHKLTRGPFRSCTIKPNCRYRLPTESICSRRRRLNLGTNRPSPSTKITMFPNRLRP